MPITMAARSMTREVLKCANIGSHGARYFLKPLVQMIKKFYAFMEFRFITVSGGKKKRH